MYSQQAFSKRDRTVLRPSSHCLNQACAFRSALQGTYTVPWALLDFLGPAVRHGNPHAVTCGNVWVHRDDTMQHRRTRRVDISRLSHFAAWLICTAP